MRFLFGSRHKVPKVNRPEEHEDIGIKLEVHYVPFGCPGYLEISYNANGRVKLATTYVDGKQYQGSIEKGLIPLCSGEHEIEVVLVDAVGKRFTKKEKITV